MIYEVWASGLGDIWASVNWLLQRSKCDGKELLVSNKTEELGGNYCHVGAMIHRIRNQLDAPDSSIRVVQQNATMKLTDHDVWRGDYLPTKVKWKSQGSKVISVQLTGARSNPEKQSIPESTQNDFVKVLTTWGLQVVAVGRPVTLEDSIRIMASSAFFAGIDSGMSHVAHSVGLPVFLFRGNLTEQWVNFTHYHKQYRLIRSVREFRINELEPNTWTPDRQAG